MLRAYHTTLGSVIFGFEGTVGPLVEDRLTVLFNDPLPIEDPSGQAVRLGLAMRERMEELLAAWRRAGYALDFVVGIDMGCDARHHRLRGQDRVRRDRHGGPPGWPAD